MMKLEDVAAKALTCGGGKEVDDAIRMVTEGLQILRKCRRGVRVGTARRLAIDTFRVGAALSDLWDMGLTVKVVDDGEN